MIVLRLSLVVLLAASLSVLLSGPASANDHPWDDSSVDSSETAGHSESEESEGTPDDIDESISVQIENWVHKFLENVFAWEVKFGDNDEERREEKKEKLKMDRTFVNVRAKVL